MAKNSKKTKQIETNENSVAEPVNDLRNGNGVAKPAVPTKKATKAKKTKPGTRARTATPGKISRAQKPQATSPTKKRIVPRLRLSDEEVRIRAYFISENRIREGRPGNSSDDWLEARRQLELEARKGA